MRTMMGINAYITTNLNLPAFRFVDADECRAGSPHAPQDPFIADFLRRIYASKHRLDKRMEAQIIGEQAKNYGRPAKRQPRR